MKKILSIVLCIALLFAIVLVNYTVIYAQTGDRFVFEAESCYDKNNTVSSVATGTYTGWNADCSAKETNQTFLIHDNNAKAVVGDYITLNLGGLEHGSYELYFGYRGNGTRCTYKIEAWDSTNAVQSAGDSVSFMATSGENVTSYGSYFYSVKTSNQISVAAGDSLTLKMTIESTPADTSHGFYIDKILLVKASSDIGTTASGATTAATSGESTTATGTTEPTVAPTTAQTTAPATVPSAPAGTVFVNANSETDAANNTYKTLAEAVAAASEGTSAETGAKIMLLSDVTIDASVKLSKAYLTLDLNGFTITARGGTNPQNVQCIAVMANHCTVQNGKMQFNTTGAGNASYLLNNANSGNVLDIKNIDFSYEKVGDCSGDGTPAGLVRATAVNVTNVYNCTFKYNASERYGTYAYLPLVSCFKTTMNLYNCLLDGGDYISAFAIQSLAANNITNLNLYNTKILNCKYLFSKSTTKDATSKSNIKFYSGAVKYVDTLCLEPELTDITKGEHTIFAKTASGESIDIADLCGPYTFYAVCSHDYENSVCKYCYASLPDEKAVNLEVLNGASIKLSGGSGIRFYIDTDVEYIKQLKSKGAKVELGTLIAPLDKVCELGSFTLDNVGENCVNVPYETEYLGTVYKGGYTAAIYDIQESNTEYSADYGNIARPMVARGYARVTLNSETYISYSDYSSVLSRSLGQISKRLQDDSDAYNKLAGDNINVWMNVRDWASIYDISNVSTTMRYDFFTVPTIGYDGKTVTEEAMLLLPSNYDENGEPSRLIIDCHGFTGSAAKLKSTYTWLQYYAHNGYAVLEVDGGGSASGYCSMGNPGAVNGNVSAYEYVIANYNIKTDGVFVKGGSMGGIVSENLVCSGRIPVIGHINECPAMSLYRQVYSYGWDPSNVKRVAKFYNFSFDKYNKDNGTSYTYDTFPWTNANKQVSDAERELFIDNFVDHVVPNCPIWKYMSCFDYETKTFKPGYEDFLTATDEARIAEMYNSITIDYPVPLAIFHGTGDRTVPFKYSQYMYNAISKSSTGYCELHAYDTASHGNFGTKQDYLCEDGSTFNALSGFDDMLTFIREQEALHEE